MSIDGVLSEEESHSMFCRYGMPLLPYDSCRFLGSCGIALGVYTGLTQDYGIYRRPLGQDTYIHFIINFSAKVAKGGLYCLALTSHRNVIAFIAIREHPFSEPVRHLAVMVENSYFCR